MKPSHVDTIQSVVRSGFAQHLERIPEFLVRGNEERLRQGWMTRHYYEMIANVIDEEKQKCVSMAGSTILSFLVSKKAQ